MRIILTMVALLGIMMSVGCERHRERDFGPWSEAQIERMEMREVESVPIFIVEF